MKLKKPEEVADEFVRQLNIPFHDEPRHKRILADLVRQVREELLADLMTRLHLSRYPELRRWRDYVNRALRVAKAAEAIEQQTKKISPSTAR